MSNQPLTKEQIEQAKSFGKGNTKMFKTATIELTVCMEPSDEVRELLGFIEKFFLEMGEYEELRYELKSVNEAVVVEMEDTKN